MDAHSNIMTKTKTHTKGDSQRKDRRYLQLFGCTKAQYEAAPPYSRAEQDRINREGPLELRETKTHTSKPVLDALLNASESFAGQPVIVGGQIVAWEETSEVTPEVTEGKGGEKIPLSLYEEIAQLPNYSERRCDCRTTQPAGYCHHVKYVDGDTLSIKSVKSKPRETICKILELIVQRDELEEGRKWDEMAIANLIEHNKRLKDALSKAWELGASHIKPSFDQLNEWRSIINE